MKINNYCAMFEALGFEARLKVFKYIIQSGNQGVAPKQIIQEFDLDSGTLSFHLKKLEKVQLITKTEAAKRGKYRVSPSLPKSFMQIFLVELANESAGFMPLL